MLPLDRTNGLGLDLVREFAERSLSPEVDAEGDLAFSVAFAWSSGVLLGVDSSFEGRFGGTKEVATESDVSPGLETSPGSVDPSTGSPSFGG